MIRIDLGSNDNKRGKSTLGTGLFKGLGGLGKLKFGGKEVQLGDGIGRLKKVVGNLGSVAIMLIAAAVAAVPHVVFLQYRVFVVNEHEARKTELNAKIASIEREIAKLKPYKKELESYEAQKSLVLTRINVIQTLLKNRGTPVNVLDALGQALPQRTWLSNVVFDLKGAKPAVNVAGQSLANEDISDYVDKLKDSTYLQEINLEEVRTIRGANNLDVRGFQLAIVPKILKPLPSAADTAAAAAAPATAAAPGKAPAAAAGTAKGGN